MRTIHTLGILGLSCFLLHCGMTAGGPGARAGRHGNESPAQVQARLERYRTWEPAPLGEHALSFADGAITAKGLSATPPKVECKNVEDHQRCGLTFDLGKDQEDTPHSIECAVELMPVPLPFGVMLHQALGKAVLTEAPVATVSWVGEGLLASVSAELKVEDEQQVVVGTGKMAVHYAPGRTTVCFDNGSGARAAFRDATAKLFGSMTSKSDPNVVSETAYVIRHGDAPAGFQYYVVRKSDDGGFVETKNDFALSSTEQAWHVSDRLVAVTRDGKGSVESFRSSHWNEGQKDGVSLSAKPSEGGKYRLKLEYGTKSEALEITPKASISTEAWEAAGLLRVANGAQPQHRYALLYVNEDGEPALAYSKLTRARAGVVNEEVERPETKKSKGHEIEKNELVVNARGQVEKQVSSDSVAVVIHSSGNHPSRGLPSKDKR
jgi:hypothetical protein